MMEIRRAVVTQVLRGILGTICKLDTREYEEALRGTDCGGDGEGTAYTGPMIVAINHINFLEVPMLVAWSYPQQLTGLVKEETWKNPFMAFLLDTYKAIPINREGSYLQTFRQVRETLAQGAHVCVAPEGTRSGTGVLGRGKAGIVQLAMITGAPILPVVHFGGEKIWDNIRHFRRTPFCFRVGRPFRFKCQGRPGKAEREVMLEELMGQMAAMLPETMRGEYAERALQKSEYLEFI
jgi:1-acyl-sn-glycerol-3-phosphate acyltransferase